ncbi:MAG TPA: acyl carrier protein [Prolixibacteraceae bacterium]|nr:acyl carrier protein [Prolixibacteraceae bacterium]
MKEDIQIKEQIRQFIIKTSYVKDDLVNNDTLIFAQGIMDSMGFISIISFIENTFSITAVDNELLEANFESVNAIAKFVTRKLQPSTNQSV